MYTANENIINTSYIYYKIFIIFIFFFKRRRTIKKGHDKNGDIYIYIDRGERKRQKKRQKKKDRSKEGDRGDEDRRQTQTTAKREEDRRQ